jgi:N-acetylmuramoyl-L-alanine amidase
MTRTNPRRIRLSLLCLLLPIALSASQQRSTVTLTIAGSAAALPAFTQHDVLYASMNAFAKQASMKTYLDASRGKMEVVIASHRVKLTAGNPFVVVIDHESNVIQQVRQLPAEVLLRNNEYYIPAQSFLPLCANLWKKRIALDEAGGAIVVSDSSAEIRPAAPAASTTPPRGATADTRSATAETPRAEPSDADSRLAPRSIAGETARNFDISHATVDARKNGTIIRLHARRSMGTPTVLESDEGTLLLSVANATVDENELAQTPFAGHDVRSISASQDGKAARIEIRLGEGVSSKNVLKDGQNNDILITLYRSAEVAQIMSDEEQDKKKTADKKKTKWKLDCIVIDAGHGGHDPGAIGITGMKEKNITLGIALKVGALIEDRMKNVKVVYTRDDDTFIELDRRGKIANEEGGKLFLSIHCNSTEKKPTTASGTEVYLLRPGRTEEAIRVAEFENSVIRLEKDYEKRYQKLTSENFILLTMAQSAYVKYSERFAELFHEQVKQGRKQRSLGVKQAGFLVLVGASMPAVLIETGFLSNPKDEALLASQAGQKHMAETIFESIQTFAEEYAKSLKE